MRWLKIAAIILGASWFFPVSCITGIVVGTNIIAKMDERHVERGDEVHSLFKVAVVPGIDGRSFNVVSLSELSTLKDDVFFRMPKPNGSIDLEGSNFSYQVIEEIGPEQIIEIVEAYHDGDNTIWSRYRATHTSAVPISSSMFYFGYMFGAFPYGFGFALFLYVIGRLLRSRLLNVMEEASTS